MSMQKVGIKISGNGMLERQQMPSGLTARVKPPGEEVHVNLLMIRRLVIMLGLW